MISGIRLLAAVAEATHAASTPGMLRALADALNEVGDVSGLELGEGDPEAQFVGVQRAGNRWQVTRGTRTLDATTREAVRRNEPRTERRNREGPRPHLVLPLAGAGASTYLAIWSRDRRLPEPMGDPEFLAQIARVVACGLSSRGALSTSPAAERRLDVESRALPSGSDDGAIVSFAAGSKALIERALRASGGRIYGPRGAAARLELKPGTLQSKMRKLGIERVRFVQK